MRVTAEGSDEGRWSLDGVPGADIVRIDVAGTLVFLVSAAAAVASDGFLRDLFVGVSLVLFGVGTVVMAAGLLRAIGRSRYEAISVADLFLLTGAPRPIRWWLQSCVAVQTVASFVAAGIRPFTGVAFGILVPVFGLAASGWWSARHGTFGERGGPGAEARPG
ncbi:MAG: hypothetical protein AAFZ07_12360 [Actinomycetota bacterium]